MWAGISPSRASGAAREGTSGAASDFVTVEAKASGACSSFSAAGAETSGSWGGQLPDRGCWGRLAFLGQGQSRGTGGVGHSPPSGACRNPLPLILSLSTKSFVAPLPPTSELPTLRALAFFNKFKP